MSPRESSETSTPPRLTATRSPATASVRRAPWTWSPRAVTVIPRGSTINSAPSTSCPATNVPVTTVPKPFTLKTRSIGSRAGRSIGRRRTADDNCTSPDVNASSPAPVVDATLRIGASSRNEPDVSSRASSAASSCMSGSAMSHLVRTMSPARRSRSRQMSKCSRVWGITDSSAATTSITRSMPPAPASMFLTKRSWPGTSTNDRVVSPASTWAKPRSIVMPLSPFFLQPIGIDPGEGAHQRALPVVDVPRRADDD